MSVPAGLSFATIATHGPIAGKKVLDGACQAVAWVRHPVGRGGAFVKDERFGRSSLLKALGVNVLLLPKVQNSFFLFGKANVGVDGFEHG